MTLDSEQQRQILLELIAQAQFPGAIVDVVYDLKTALVAAAVDGNAAAAVSAPKS